MASYSSPRSSGSDEAEEKVFVAVVEEYKESEATLAWALQNNHDGRKIVLVHVHRPSRMIPIKGWWFSPNQLEPAEVQAYRKQEMENMNKALDEYMLVCKTAKIRCEKLVVTETENVAKALLDLILQLHITRLVMGAAADKHYSKKMTSPKSKVASAVRKKAPAFCIIWFICKGNLITTKEATASENKISRSTMPSPMASPSRPGWSASTLSSHSSDSPKRLGYYSRNISSSNSDNTPWGEISYPSPPPAAQGTQKSFPYTNGVPKAERNDTIGSQGVLYLEVGETVKNIDFNFTSTSNVSEYLSVSSRTHSAQKFDDKVHLSLAQDQQDTSGVDDSDLYNQLQQALLEAAHLKDDAYEESIRRRKAEMDLLEANRRVKVAEAKYAKEVQLRAQIEDDLAKQRTEIENLEKQRDEVFEELQVQSNRMVKDFEEKMSEARKTIESLQKERDDVLRELEELEQAEEETNSTTCGSPNFLEFPRIELEHATHNFDDSMKIGTGGYGTVYKGFLRHTLVAIKMLHSQGLRRTPEFYQEVKIISRLRHPNLLSLIGACAEARALVYEFLPNGSLEDHLSCKDNRLPLPWKVRISIISELCSALIFLHSDKPQGMVHGDLRPANILLDANFVSKIADFGIRRFIQPNTNNLYRWTDPKGSFVYLDPEFFSTGELSTSSDVYSFGVVVLRLLTGKSALGIVKEVQEAIDAEKTILDTAAGNWPSEEGKQLLQLGIDCCEMNRRHRPSLANNVWKILGPMHNAVLSS